MGAVAKESPRTWRKPGYWRIVEQKLKRYPRLKRAVKDWELLPSCTPSYEEKTSPGYSEFISTTEKFGIKRAEKKREVERIDNALGALSDLQRVIIEEYYFNKDFPGVIIFCEQYGLSKTKYHELKREAIDTIAEVLNLK